MEFPPKWADLTIEKIDLDPGTMAKQAKEYENLKAGRKHQMMFKYHRMVHFQQFPQKNGDKCTTLHISAIYKFERKGQLIFVIGEDMNPNIIDCIGVKDALYLDYESHTDDKLKRIIDHGGKLIYLFSQRIMIVRDALILNGFRFTDYIKSRVEYADDGKRSLDVTFLKNMKVGDGNVYTFTEWKRDQGKEIPLINAISGIVHEVYMQGRGRTFYLFGDQHVRHRSPPCGVKNEIGIDDLFEIAMTEAANEGRVLDIHVELSSQGFATNQLDGMDNEVFIKHLYQKLRPCYRKKCTFQHRIHGDDIRHYSNFEYSTTVVSDLISAAHEVTLNPVNNKIAYDRYYRQLALAFSQLDQGPNGVYNDYRKVVFTHRKLRKQLDAIKDVDIREYITKKVELTLASFKGLSWEQYAKRALGTRIFFFSDAEIMDAFILARMFRSFRKIPGRYSEDQQSIIIHAGDAHIRAIVKDLLNLGIRHTIDYPESLIQCVNLPLRLPLFKTQPFTKRIDPVVTDPRQPPPRNQNIVDSIYPKEFYITPFPYEKRYVELLDICGTVQALETYRLSKVYMNEGIFTKYKKYTSHIELYKEMATLYGSDLPFQYLSIEELERNAGNLINIVSSPTTSIKDLRWNIEKVLKVYTLTDVELFLNIPVIVRHIKNILKEVPSPQAPPIKDMSFFEKLRHAVKNARYVSQLRDLGRGHFKGLSKLNKSNMEKFRREFLEEIDKMDGRSEKKKVEVKSKVKVGSASKEENKITEVKVGSASKEEKKVEVKSKVKVDSASKEENSELIAKIKNEKRISGLQLLAKPYISGTGKYRLADIETLRTRLLEFLQKDDDIPTNHPVDIPIPKNDSPPDIPISKGGLSAEKKRIRAITAIGKMKDEARNLGLSGYSKYKLTDIEDLRKRVLAMVK